MMHFVAVFLKLCLFTTCFNLAGTWLLGIDWFPATVVSVIGNAPATLWICRHRFADQDKIAWIIQNQRNKR